MCALPELQGNPLSWLCVPIKLGGQTVGALRCTNTRKAPFYFTLADEVTLERVASELGRWWGLFTEAHAASSRNRAFLNATEHLLKLGIEVDSQFESDRPNLQDTLVAEACATTSLLVGRKTSVVIRSFNKEAETLIPFGSNPEAGGLAGAIQDLPLNSGMVAAKAIKRLRCIFRSTDLLRLDDLCSESHRWVMICPVTFRDECYGTLELRGSSPLRDRKEVESIATFMSQQLGVLWRTLEKAQEIRNLSRNAAKSEREQADVFQDLGHQLESPLIQARRRVKRLVRSDSQANTTISPVLTKEHLVISGLLRKASRVANSMKLFEELHQGKLASIEKKRISVDQLRKLLIECASDHEAAIDPDREVRFHVDRESVRLLQQCNISVDINLLEQAINTLADNASKYSNMGSCVEFYCGVTKSNRFHVSVSNSGPKVRDWQRCLKRGHREPEAESYTQEGHGIGLWIVDGIMKAHGGEVVFDVNYNYDSRTHVRLLFGPDL